MIKKFFITILLLFFLTNSAVAAIRYSRAPKNPYVSKQLQLPYFQAIQANGNVDLQIDGSPYGQSVCISGRLKDTQAVRMFVKGKTLYIASYARCQPSCRVKVRLAISRLDQLNYTQGTGNISIKQSWPSYRYPLSLNICGNPKVSINGNVRLCKLVAGGNAEISLYWINSDDLYLRAMNKARVCLAGTVGTLEAYTFQSAWINARYLRAKRAFVKSYNSSRIDVRVVCSLNALASQNSGIYYYQDPKFQAPYMQCAGSVVNMSHICYPPCSICDNACCKNGWH